jgi:two-component system, NtrC family, response regulator AtoC
MGSTKWAPWLSVFLDGPSETFFRSGRDQMTHKILCVDDDLSIRTMLDKALRAEGYDVITAINGEEAIELVESQDPDLILLDVGLPGINGIETLTRIKKANPDASAIMITAEGTIESAVAAMKAGARNYIQKPFNTDELQLLIAETLETVRLKKEVSVLRSAQRDRSDVDRVVAESPSFKRVLSMAQRIGESDSTTVLIEGESGTGKEHIAQMIHYKGVRADGPFIAINCGAIPKDLVESELFGNEKGAFTGASTSRIGKFEAADGGTLFLDEIGELSPDNQIKLLRVLEERSFYRLGGTKNINIDVRIVAATNRNLQEATENGEFREDLFYRLNVATIFIPPLRDRRDDIIPLVQRFLNEFAGSSDEGMRKINPVAENVLLNYEWKGNVREVRNAVERIALLEEGDTLLADHLDFLGGVRRSSMARSEGAPAASGSDGFSLPAEGVILDELNKDLIRQALEMTGGNQVKAAKLLGLTRGTLRYRLDKYGIQS